MWIAQLQAAPLTHCLHCETSHLQIPMKLVNNVPINSCMAEKSPIKEKYPHSILV